MDDTVKVLVGFAVGYIGVQIGAFIATLIFDWLRNRRDGWR